MSLFSFLFFSPFFFFFFFLVSLSQNGAHRRENRELEFVVAQLRNDSADGEQALSSIREKAEGLAAALVTKDNQLHCALQDIKSIQEQAAMDRSYIEQSQRREKALENETSVQAKHVRMDRVSGAWCGVVNVFLLLLLLLLSSRELCLCFRGI